MAMCLLDPTEQCTCRCAAPADIRAAEIHCPNRPSKPREENPLLGDDAAQVVGAGSEQRHRLAILRAMNMLGISTSLTNPLFDLCRSGDPTDDNEYQEEVLKTLSTVLARALECLKELDPVRYNRFLRDGEGFDTLHQLLCVEH